MLGNGDGHFDPEFIRVFGYKVAIRKLNIEELVCHDGIYIPETSTKGFKAIKGEVLCAGIKAMDEFGIQPGDIVRFDQCSVIYDTTPVVIVNAENIIIKLAGDTPVPLKNRVFVKEVGNISDFEDNSIILPEKKLDASIGVIIAVENEDVVSIGDHIILTTDMDRLKGPDGVYMSYIQDNILATIEI